MKCVHCGNEVLQGQSFCPKCGRRVGEKRVAEDTGSRGPSWGLFIGVLVLAGLVFAGYHGYSLWRVTSLRESGEIAYKRGDYKKCVKDLKYVVSKRIKGSSNERMLLARCYFEDGKPKDAVKQIEQAYEWDAKNADVLALWARLLYDTGDTAGAADKADSALKLDENNLLARQALLLARIKDGNLQEAEKMLPDAVQNADRGPECEIYNAMGQAYLDANNAVGAIKYWEKSIEVFTNQFEVLVKLARLHSVQKDYMSCYDFAKRARQLTEKTEREKWEEANSLAESCGSVAKTLGLEDCFVRRRDLDREFHRLRGELVGIYYEQRRVKDDEVEIFDEEDEGIYPELEDLDIRVTALTEKYTRLQCKTDDDQKNFSISKTVMIGQSAQMQAAIDALLGFLRQPDEEKRVLVYNAMKNLDAKSRDVRGMWCKEEERFKFEPIMPGCDELDAKEEEDEDTPRKPEDLSKPGAMKAPEST